MKEEIKNTEKLAGEPLLGSRCLRIGNVTNFGLVCEIGEDYFRVRDQDGNEFKNKWADIQPIKINREWLFRLGFYQSYQSDKGGEMGCYMNDFVGVVLAENGLYAYNHSGSICNTFYFVHELQNLFHALTGRDLIVKEPQSAGNGA